MFARGKRSQDALFTVLGLPNAGPEPRLGLAIAKKAAKDAVVRNRLKRVARETFRKLDLLPLDFVVMAKPRAAAVANRDLANSLTAHFMKLGGSEQGKS